MATTLPSLTETHIAASRNITRMIQLQENTDGSGSSSSSSTSPIITSSGFMYDVFLSFRGADTRDGFTSFLYTDLDDARLLVYKDDVELHAGEDILPALMDAIERSKVSIIIFSPNYASSKSCLQEVAKVKECRTRQQIVLPIFYHIDPSDVRNQRGPFKKYFRQHRRKGVDPQLLNQSEKALREIGFLKGYPVWPNINQGKLVKEIVSVVMGRVRTSEIPVDGNLVGIKQRMEDVIYMLQASSGDAQTVGICGLAGIGKTTLAKVVYNNLRHDFQGCSFISEIRKGDILALQNQLISDLKKRNSNRLDSKEASIKFISDRFKGMKVLIVLDDVEYLDHIKAFCVECFGSGSRIILTTRRPGLLDEAKVQNRYQVNALSEHHALRLFRRHAFQEDSPEGDYCDLSAKIASKTGGIPLVIEWVGSRLYYYRNRERERWEEVLQELRSCENEPLRTVLDTSYEKLKPGHQKIFLDIACFLTGESHTIADYMWRACGFGPIDARDTLVGMSLLKIGENDKILMSNPIREYGRSQVSDKDTDPEKRSRLWIHEEALEVLKGKKGSHKIQAMCLQFDNDLHECLTGTSRPAGVHDQVDTIPSFGYSQKFLNFLRSFMNIPGNFLLMLFSSREILEPSLLMAENFTTLSDLRFLRLDRAKIKGDFRNLLPKLRWLDWKNCPEFPQEVRNLYLEKLEILDMSCSNVTEDWSGWNPIKEKAENLKVLLLAECKRLHEFPSFPECRQLERLNFEGCSQLMNISIPSGTTRTLRYLNLKGCGHITELHEDLCSMENLETLIIDGTDVKKISFGRKMKKLKEFSACRCENLKTMDDSIGNVESLSLLSLDNSSIEILPNSIGSLSKLQTLSLRNCKKVTELPSTVERLTSLVKMDLSFTTIRELPPGVHCLSNLRELVMEKTYLTQFPEAILELRSLETIDFTDCTSMRGNIPDGITGLSSLKTLRRSATDISSLPTCISKLSQLQVLDIYGCEELELEDSMTWPPSLIFYRAGSRIGL